MSISPGTQLGSFEIGALLGVGGMGEVYRARDLRLGREVAIKVLPEAFAQNKERLARFEREAKLLASLNHANIAAIHELREESDVHFLVMELVEGRTLADRIAGGAIPMDEALPLFAQIAEALESAHEHGIIHRDLKPANIKITEEGKVKVLDFGLAKALEGDPSESGEESPGSDISTKRAILGTPAYMSPEQARGKPLDVRTDIWSFGCCLYEALTRERPFKGETTSDLLAEILKSEPDWGALPQTIPPAVQLLVRRCLQKEPHRRLQHIGDARIEISETSSDGFGTSSWPPTAVEEEKDSRARSPLVFGGVLIAGVAIGALAMLLTRPEPPAAAEPEKRPVRRYSISLPRSSPLATPFIITDRVVAISPDGSRLVYGSNMEGTRRLVLRELDELDVRVLEGTEGATYPFFSPDSQWIGFFTTSGRRLMKVSVRGGTPVTICSATLPLGANWGDDGNIYFASEVGQGLFKVPSAGGTPESLTTPDPSSGDVFHVVPHVLPGSKALIYVSAPTPATRGARLILLTLDGLERRLLVEDAIRPHYSPTGHLIYVQQGTLMAVGFDPVALEMTGTPTQVTEQRMATPETLPDQYAWSADGTLVYPPVASLSGLHRSLVWVDHEGNEEAVPTSEGALIGARLSPDGSRVAINFADLLDIWILDLTQQSAPSRLTFHAGVDLYASWSPDGRKIAFVSNRDGPFNVYWKLADGTGTTQRLVAGPGTHLAASWTPDGESIVFERIDPETAGDIGVVPIDAPDEVRMLLTERHRESQPAISPDGQRIAYVSDETGRLEVYVRSYPDLAGKWQISTGGGDEPLWSRDGRSLYFRSGNRMMAAALETEGGFRPGAVRVLFDRNYYKDPEVRNYDLSPDGARFLMIKEGEADDDSAGPLTELIVVENWFQELKRLAPVAEN